MSVVTPVRCHSLAYTNTVSIPVSKNAHQTQLPEMPRTRMISVNRFAELVDVVVAMGVASLINMAMLIMAATTFFKHGLTGVGSLETAHRTLEPLLGKGASWIFAVSLLASGLSSSAVGTMAGQVMMQGFLKRRIPVLIRRVVTIVPSLVVIAVGVTLHSPAASVAHVPLESVALAPLPGAA